MKLKIYTCSRCVGKNSDVIKYGKTANGKQRYQCTGCSKTSVLEYSYNAYSADIDSKIILFTKEGLGIRSTSRILKISPTTLLNRILKIAELITPPKALPGKEYQVDEICTYIWKKSNRIWIAYSIETLTKNVMNFSVGRRSNNTLLKVIDPLLISKPVTIFTDRLKVTPTLFQKPYIELKDMGRTRLREATSICERI